MFVAEAFGWTQLIVILLLIGVMFFGIALDALIKRRKRNSVYGHRVYWE